MEKEINLSEKISKCSCKEGFECKVNPPSIKIKFIKTFIKLLKEYFKGKPGYIAKIDKLAGPKFIHNDKTNCYY